MANTSTIKNTRIPHFDNYICVGDYVTWQKDGFTFTATIHDDLDTTPDDTGCYPEKKIQAWKNHDWYFCGIVISVEKEGVKLSDNAANLWGIECNYNKKGNGYLRAVCMELQDDVLIEAKMQAQKIIQALSK